MTRKKKGRVYEVEAILNHVIQTQSESADDLVSSSNARANCTTRLISV